MRLFHLADLHLGKRVNGFSMIEDQEYILHQITELANQEKPDGVIIAGDVYDKSIPSVEAVNLFDDFLVSLVQRNLQVFIISGNHDSAERVSYGGRVMEHSGIHISPRITGSTSDELDASAESGINDADALVSTGNNSANLSRVQPIRLEDEYGILNVYLFPYIHPSVIRAIWPDEAVSNWTDAMSVLIGHADVDPKARNIAVAHQFVTALGVRPEESDSEQKHIGGLDNVEYSVFDPFDYVALELYDGLFEHLMRKRRIRGAVLEKIKQDLSDHAYRVYCNDEDTAEVESEKKDENWIVAFYVKTGQGGNVGFFHRSFYQYFLARYILFRIFDIVTDEQAEKLIGLFAERELDKTVRQFLSLLINEKNKKAIHNRLKLVIKALLRTEAYLNLEPRYHHGNAERTKLGRTINVYRNTLHILAAFSYVIENQFRDGIDVLLRIYPSSAIKICSTENKRADLSSAYLVGAILVNADLSGANLNQTDLRGTNLSRANLSGADLSETDLRGANLGQADLRGTNLRGASLREANLRGANLSGTDLSSVDLRGANLSIANLNGAILSEPFNNATYLIGVILIQADLRGASLREANLSGADLRGADLYGADLRGACLRGASLREANLSGADLSGADLYGADLRGACLRGANLSGADLSGAILNEADLSEAFLLGAHLDEST